MHETIIEIIKGMLAPGIMISACGLWPLFFYGKILLVSILAFTLFIIALLAVLWGVIFAAKEVRLGFDILTIETKNIL